MGQFGAIILTFVLTGIVGNFLLHRWQLRTWMHQQRYLGQEREFQTLRDLIEEITKLMSTRLYHMRRLLSAARTLSDDEIKDRFAAYDKTLIAWNESLSSFLVRLRFAGEYGNAIDLERRIQEPFVKLGSDLERISRRRLAGDQSKPAEYNKLENQANDMHGRIIAFSRDLRRVAEDRRRRVYFGIKIRYTAETLTKFSTWELVKALFIREVDFHSVARTSADPQIPLLPS